MVKQTAGRWRGTPKAVREQRATMPELPEAETIARQLQAVLPGRQVRCVRVLRADVIKGGADRLRRALPGRIVERVYRHGKRVVLRLDNGQQLLFALGMTGQVVAARRDRPLADHTHLCIELDLGRELRFRDPRRFGGVWLLDASDKTPGLSLGPDAASVRWSEFRPVLARRRQIKPLLMDQAAVAGLGNIYTDEALHRAGIHPLTPANRLLPAEGKRLLRAIRQVLREAVRQGGSTIRDYQDANGSHGLFQARFRVYGRAGLPCPRCGTAIRRLVVAGRGTHVCPRCQRRRRQVMSRD
jgi:formamidopyrimidine-DNA glycosylase